MSSPHSNSTLTILWTIAAMLFLSSLYLGYLVASLPDIPENSMIGAPPPAVAPV